jgi:hypothetical protein
MVAGTGVGKPELADTSQVGVVQSISMHELPALLGINDARGAVSPSGSESVARPLGRVNADGVPDLDGLIGGPGQYFLGYLHG